MVIWLLILIATKFPAPLLYHHYLVLFIKVNIRNISHPSKLRTLTRSHTKYLFSNMQMPHKTRNFHTSHTTHTVPHTIHTSSTRHAVTFIFIKVKNTGSKIYCLTYVNHPTRFPYPIPFKGGGCLFELS